MLFSGIGVFHELAVGHLGPSPDTNPSIDCEKGSTEYNDFVVDRPLCADQLIVE